MKQMDLERKGTKADELAGCDIIGIDLGTTNSAVSVFSADTVPTILPIGKGGKRTVPSCVRWNEDGTYTVGEDAYNERFKQNVIYSVKRIMGSGKTVTLHHDSGSIELTPAQVSAEILRHIKDRVAEFYRPVEKCVITVPAYFDQRQMNDTIEAAKLAGLDCIQILKEPTSASFIYSLLGYAQSGAVLIYDLGGGTFDATHMTFLRRDSVPKKMATSLRRQYGIELDKNGGDITDQYYSRVIGTWGDMQLGGDDIDKLFGDKAAEKAKVDLTAEEKELLYLRCEEFKKNDASAMDVNVNGKTIHLDEDTLNECVDAIYQRTLEIIKEVDMATVSTIVLVGGSTQSKRLQTNLQQTFPDKEISVVLDPDATVALGAGAVAKALSNKKSLDYSDVLPLPIGVLVNEKQVEVCLKKNTSMPYSASRTYYTVHDNQERVTVHVYQGLSVKPENCTYLGRVTVEGVPPKPAGDVAVRLTFVLTSEGRLKVISRVDGVDAEQELIVDNIFTSNTAEQAQQKTRDFDPQDDFETMVIDTIDDDNSDILNLLKQRRTVLQSGEDASNLETEIFSKVYG